ncbi:Glutathione peroxidase [Fragilaria crotonensis]|nr:Glutathione peroxidase [Fragilaria crotonensis]
MSSLFTRSMFRLHDMTTNLFFGKETPIAVNHFYDLKDRNMEGNDLVKLYDEYHSQGFKILAFPCNQFGGQEPGSDEQILEFASKYGADKKFIWFTKGHVNGADTRPVYSFLKDKLPGPDESRDIRWNFTTFLIDREGNPSHRFSPSKTVYNDLKPAVEELLAKKAVGSPVN